MSNLKTGRSPEPEPDRSAEARHARYATDHSPEQGPSLPALNVLMLCRQPVDDLAAIDVSAFEPTDIRTAIGAKMNHVSANVRRTHFFKLGSVGVGKHWVALIRCATRR
jgi:hypothetical protein